MQQWEYMTEFVRIDIDNDGVKDSLKQMGTRYTLEKFPSETVIPQLNNRGEAGWELVYMQPVNAGTNSEIVLSLGEGEGAIRWSNVYFCVFKRLVRETFSQKDLHVLINQGNKPLWLSRVDLSGAYLQEVDLEGASLIACDLSGANLQNANLTKANCQGANLSGADLRRANLSATDFRGAKLVNADLRWTQLKGTIFDDDSKISKKWLLVREIVSHDKQERNLENTDLSEANLKGVELRSANLSEANLYNTDLSGASLDAAILRHTNLKGTNLAHTGLDWAYFVGSLVDETTKIPDRWRLIWEIVNSTKKDLDLRGVDLEGANLCGVNLSKAKLEPSDIFNYGPMSQLNPRKPKVSYDEATVWPEGFVFPGEIY